jgi:copper homeostasis protein
MEQDVATAKELGADGNVFGILKEDGNVDTAELAGWLIWLAPGVTVHRAFDMRAIPADP